MKKAKKKALILGGICLAILVGAVVVDLVLGKSYFKEIKYDQLVNKIEKKESLVVLFSKTTCTHCMDFKPKLEHVANKYKINIYYLETDLLDEDTYKELKTKFSFSGTPTTVFIIDGEEKTAATRINGDVSEEKIVNKLKSNGFIK